MIWKPIKDYEVLYCINEVGDVKTLKTNLIRKQHLSCKGYLIIRLSGKVKKTFSTHRLVAQAFIPNPENKPYVNHMNGKKTDNSVENLEWCNAAENNKHAYDIGIKISVKGENHGSSKLTNDDIYEIRRKHEIHEEAKKYSPTNLAREYNVSTVIIHKIFKKEIWKHI